MKLIGNLNCDIYREHPLTVTHHFSRGMYDLCSDAIRLGVNIKFPKEFYEEKNTILLNLKTYHKGGGIYMHLSCDGVVNSRGSFIERMYLNHCGEYEGLFRDVEETMESISSEIVFQVCLSLSGLYHDVDFEFKAELVINRCEVHLFGDNEIDKKAEEFIKNEINKELLKARKEGE